MGSSLQRYNNMINFNEKDYFITDIKQLCKFDAERFKHKYRVYGLRKEGNPLIKISYPCSNSIDFNAISNFLSINNIDVRWDEDDYLTKTFKIGVRLDLREATKFCSCLIKTLVYSIEGRVNVFGYRVQDRPTFRN